MGSGHFSEGMLYAGELLVDLIAIHRSSVSTECRGTYFQQHSMQSVYGAHVAEVRHEEDFRDEVERRGIVLLGKIVFVANDHWCLFMQF